MLTRHGLQQTNYCHLSLDPDVCPKMIAIAHCECILLCTEKLRFAFENPDLLYSEGTAETYRKCCGAGHADTMLCRSSQHNDPGQGQYQGKLMCVSICFAPDQAEASIDSHLGEHSRG